MKKYNYRMGIDVGSTTAKVVILNQDAELVFSAYRRHHAETLDTIKSILKEAEEILGDVDFDLLVTGSAGMGLGEKFDLPFIQEVVASAEVVRQLYPEAKTLVDIGGEDAKMIFFDDEGRPDIRMNGSCAGGTGAFIDEMATLLNVPVSELDDLAKNYKRIYPMASRCGVFAKTDLQNLLSRDISKEDISASVFRAVVLQVLATLSRGHEPAPLFLFSGGPLTFLPELRKAFEKGMEITSADILEVENAELLPAMGAALAESSKRKPFTLSKLFDQLCTVQAHSSTDQVRLAPLFIGKDDFSGWKDAQEARQIGRVDVSELNGENLFLGVDSGSTTTKVVLVDEAGRIAFDYYRSNRGDAIEAVRNGFRKIRQRFDDKGISPKIAGSVVTGYGEDLIKSAFSFDEGMVETLAHFQAAKAFDEDVSFIMDIGGQDMKAIFVKDGEIQSIEINEACSSGCGSFIESFSSAMGYEVKEFAQLAVSANAPCDLGTRCTVFMNSKVKQALREGAEINDISAGLAYSVIKNALHKVLKVTDIDVLGDNIVVQGGTFRNPAIQKALEELLGKEVTCPDIAELMGAYGAALTARDSFSNNGYKESSFSGLENLDEIGIYDRRDIRCRGCENICVVSKMTFPNENVFYSGNRCENIFSNSGETMEKGRSMTSLKYDLLFKRKTDPEIEPVMTIGIPRVLNIFENFPFWNTLLVESGIKVHLSAPSSTEIYQSGAGYIMSDNLCFPAKLVAGHIIDLVDAGVDRIFYPMVFFEEEEFSDSDNVFNCPIVSGYAEVIGSVMAPQEKFDIPYDTLEINFNDEKLLKKVCTNYLKELGISKGIRNKAFEKALVLHREHKEEARVIGKEIIEEARANERSMILLLGRPYHIDPLINHKIHDILTNFGLDVITVDSVPVEEGQTLDNRHVMTQWEYVSRYYHALRWAGEQDNVEVVQLNSFGCGPDAFIMEEVKTILAQYGKTPTVIRIDEIESAGSTKLRLRSMMEALKNRKKDGAYTFTPRRKVKTFGVEDRDRTIIVPDFSPYNSPALVRPFMDMGYKIVALPPANRETVDVGLKFVNNDVCYPALICVGDLVKALQSGEFDIDTTAVGFSQTGGQCRATSYPSMIKKALLSAGFEDVPVVTFSTSLDALNDQPGFEFDIKKYVYKTAVSIMYTDALSDLYYATALREKNKGSAEKVRDKYLNLFMEGETLIKKATLLESLEDAVRDFNAIETIDKEYPKVGIVGEIYVKYNAFANNYVAEWLMEQGIEVFIPPFIEFFSGGLVSIAHGVKTNLKKADALWLLSFLGKKLLSNFLRAVDGVMQEFQYYHPHHDIQDMADKAEEILSLNHLYGENWLIAGEIASFVDDGIKNVLCLQPFGCIANHIVAKGIQKRMKDKYPKLNLLFLDTDAGVSEVNYFNRMHFFVNNAKAGVADSAV